MAVVAEARALAAETRAVVAEARALAAEARALAAEARALAAETRAIGCNRGFHRLEVYTIMPRGTDSGWTASPAGPGAGTDWLGRN